MSFGIGTNESTTQQTTNNQSGVTGGGASITGSDNVIFNSQNDFGAISGGLALANNSLDLANNSQGNAFAFGAGALNFAGDIASQSLTSGSSIAGQAFDFAKANNASATNNYESLLTTTSTALSGILGGIASTQNFIADTQATAKGTLDSRTIMVLGAVAAAVAVAYVFRKGKQ